MFGDLTLEQVVVLWVFHYLLIFCRIGSSLMLLPGIGEAYVPPTVRLLTALGISLIILPIISPQLSKDIPGDIGTLAVLIFAEIITGLFIGMMVRIMLSMIHVAGMIIAFQSSLASALLFDINQGNQGSMVGNFMTILAVTVIFTSNLHHLLILGITQSYNLYLPGIFPPLSDFSEMAAKMVSNGFLIGFKIAAPVLVVSMILYLGAGVMSRLMPNMQIFFVMVPVQITISFLILMITISAGMMWYLNYYHDAISFLDASRDVSR